MNAVSVYIATCRYIVQANQYDQDSLADLNRYLPYLRQAISCCVCGELQGHRPLCYSFPIALVAMLTFCVIVCKSDHQHFKNCCVYCTDTKDRSDSYNHIFYVMPMAWSWTR